MSEMIPEQRQAVHEHAKKDNEILESIPEIMARLDTLREVYGPGGAAKQQYARLSETQQQLAEIHDQLAGRRAQIDADLIAARARFEELCAQVGNQSEASIIINPESVKDDVFTVTQQLGKLPKQREAIEASIKLCSDDAQNTALAREALARQRKGKVSAALQLIANLNETLRSIDDVTEFDYVPVVDPTLSVDEYSEKVKEQPQNASTLNWAKSVFDEALLGVEQKESEELRQAAMPAVLAQGDGGVERTEGVSGDELQVSPELMSLLSGNREQ